MNANIILYPYKPYKNFTPDMEKLLTANKLYESLPYHDRNDAMAMPYLIPG